MVELLRPMVRHPRGEGGRTRYCHLDAHPSFVLPRPYPACAARTRGPGRVFHVKQATGGPTRSSGPSLSCTAPDGSRPAGRYAVLLATAKRVGAVWWPRSAPLCLKRSFQNPLVQRTVLSVSCSPFRTCRAAQGSTSLPSGAYSLAIGRPCYHRYRQKSCS